MESVNPLAKYTLFNIIGAMLTFKSCWEILTLPIHEILESGGIKIYWFIHPRIGLIHKIEWEIIKKPKEKKEALPFTVTDEKWRKYKLMYLS